LLDELVAPSQPTIVSFVNAHAVNLAWKNPPIGEVFVVSATDTYSTSAASPFSASHGIPLLLTSNGQLDAQSAAWLEANRHLIGRLVLVGSEASVPAAVTIGFPWVRIDGVHYSQRAARLNARYFPVSSKGKTRPVVATLPKPAEYLIAGSRAGHRAQPLIPVSDKVLPPFTREWISNRRAPIGGFEIVTDGSIPYLMDSMLAKAEYL